MGIFSNIGKAEHYQGGKYITPGLFLVELQKVKQGKTRNGREFFVVEMKVLESSSLKEHPVGTDMSHMIMLDQDAALGNVRHFLSVASDAPFSEIEESDAIEAVSEQNPLQGVKLRAMAVNIKTRAQKDFTKVKWMSMETSAEDAAREHAKEIAAQVPAASAAVATA